MYKKRSLIEDVHKHVLILKHGVLYAKYISLEKYALFLQRERPRDIRSLKMIGNIKTYAVEAKNR